MFEELPPSGKSILRQCPICQKLKDLKLCSSCLLVSFCSRKHQVEFWPCHKDLCKRICELLTSTNSKSLYEVPAFRGSGSSPRQILQGTVLKVLVNTPKVLGRDLNPNELELLMHPKFCGHCANTDSRELEDCLNCFNVSFCKNGPCKEESMKSHQSMCQAYKLIHKVSSLPICEMVFDPENSIPRAPEAWPCDLFELLESLSGRTFSRQPETEEEVKGLVLVSIFSFTATILNILKTCQMISPDRETLIVHVVGAEYEISYISQETCTPIFSFLRNLRTLEVLFVGPELMRGSEHNQDLSLIHDKVLKFRYLKDTYEKVETSTPDLVICFNSGFTEKASKKTNPWTPGVKAILSHSSTIVAFTSYTRSEVRADSKFLEAIAETEKKRIEKVLVGERNPFREHRPLRNLMIYEAAEDGDELFYVNGYLTVYRIQ